MMRMYGENQRKADNRAEAQAAITGATPEQKLASKEVNRRAFADSVADIASNASRMRDQYLRDYRADRNRYYAQRLGMQDQLAGIEQNISNQWSSAAVNAFKGGAQLLGNGIDKNTSGGYNTDNTNSAGDDTNSAGDETGAPAGAGTNEKIEKN